MQRRSGAFGLCLKYSMHFIIYDHVTGMKDALILIEITVSYHIKATSFKSPYLDQKVLNT